MDETLSYPQPCDAPEESISLLSQLIQRTDVLGCIALTYPDMRVVWNEGVALASPEKLAKIVHFVQEMLKISHHHIEDLEQEDEANLLRIRTRNYELIITPSGYFGV